ncbi:MAG: LysR family transcriptional regulator, partial [Candidatus Binatia bacterium]
MTLHQLKLLCALAKHRNLTQVGVELFLSQPAVTLQFKELQKEFGVPLYERLGKTLHLTEAGTLLEGYARRILALVDEAETALRTHQRENGGRIRVGASNTPGIYLLPSLFRTFCDLFPTVELRIVVENTQAIAEKISHNQLDLGVVGGTLERAELRTIPWLTDTLLLAVSPQHHWAKRRAVALHELTTERFLGRESGSATRATYERAFIQHGLTLPETAEIGDLEAIKRAVEVNLGIAILSIHSVAREVAEGRLVSLPLQGVQITRPLSIIYHKDKTLTVPMQQLLELLQREPKQHSPSQQTRARLK